MLIIIFLFAENYVCKATLTVDVGSMKVYNSEVVNDTKRENNVNLKQLSI
jgi:hypothetical protein